MKTEYYNATIPKNVIRIINEAGMKQGVVAERAGYSKQQFSDMLNGRKIIKASDIIVLAKVLNVLPNELFGITENEKV